MSSITEDSSLSKHGCIVRAARLIAKSAAELWIAYRNRQEINQLAHFDAGMLKDIGLTPSDVNAAIYEPLWRDPSSILVSAQLERRSARSASGKGQDKFIERL